MSDEQTFMELPSLMRQAMERSAGFSGIEAINREKPVPYVVVTKEDWVTIRDHIIAMQESIDRLLRDRNARSDAFID